MQRNDYKYNIHLFQVKNLRELKNVSKGIESIVISFLLT